jgi:hypothetical protein
MPRTVALVALALLLAGAAFARAAAPPEPAAVLAAVAAVPPLMRSGSIERHTPETLWERIDGEAELYKAHGLAASAHAVYADPALPERRIELSVFLMAGPRGAAGIFEAFRPPDCTPLTLGQGGCAGDYQGFFWQDGWFVLADAAGPAASRPADVRGALAAAAAALDLTPAAP